MLFFFFQGKMEITIIVSLAAVGMKEKRTVPTRNYAAGTFTDATWNDAND